MKNKFMRIAAVMLMLCLVTTCAISGTIAKYTNAASGKDQARVAYWGFNGTDADIKIDDLFKTSYDNANVSGKADVIAPGTKNSTTFKFTYNAGITPTPEVAYTFTVDTSSSRCADEILKNPNIKWTLDTTTFVTSDTDGYAFDQLIAAIKALAGTSGNGATNGVANYSASADTLPDITKGSHTIAWEWVFDTTDDADQDKMDTDMGNSTTALEVVIDIKVTATQVD